MSDVDYTPAKSIADLPITNPAHLPCPDMAGMEKPNPEKLKRSRFLLQKLREKHGLNKRKSNHQLSVDALEWENQ